MLRATVFGLYVGVDAIASTRPVCGSSATTAPPQPAEPAGGRLLGRHRERR